MSQYLTLMGSNIFFYLPLPLVISIFYLSFVTLRFSVYYFYLLNKRTLLSSSWFGRQTYH